MRDNGSDAGVDLALWGRPSYIGVANMPFEEPSYKFEEPSYEFAELIDR